MLDSHAPAKSGTGPALACRNQSSLAATDWLELARRTEKAIRAEFGVRTDSPTGRATDGRCVLACAGIAQHLTRRGLRARWVAGALLVARPGCQPLEVGLHAIVVVGEDLLFDPTISQVYRPRFGSCLDVDALLIPAPSGVLSGRGIRTAQSGVVIEFMPDDQATALVATTPDAEASRVLLIASQL